MDKEKRLTYKQSIDGYTDVGLCEGVTIDEAICKLADYEDATDNNVGHKWISVKDRLPELHTKVLCCGIKGGRFIAELGTWGHERHLYWDKKNGRGCPEVTHWMPLPEPPKGE